MTPSERQAAFLALQELRAAQDTAPKAKRLYVAARAALATANHGLVVRLAQRWVCAGAELEDLVQEGVIGLLDAIDGFDPSKGTKFSTYAAFFINGAIASSRPRNTLGRLSIGEQSVRYAERLAVEDSKSFGTVDEAKAEAKDKPKSKRKHSQETVAAMRAWKHSRMESLDDRGAEEASLSERLADDTAVDPFEAYAAKQERAQLMQAIQELDPAEARVLGWGFGIVEAG